MSVVDGTAGDLSYGEAIEQIVAWVGWPSEALRDQVLKAVRVQHGTWVEPPPAAPPPSDPRDVRIAELEALAEAQRVAELAKQAELVAAQNELAALKAH